MQHTGSAALPGASTTDAGPVAVTARRPLRRLAAVAALTAALAVAGYSLPATGAAQATPSHGGPVAPGTGFAAAPRITSLFARTGPTAGGTSVYVAGDTAGATAVLFDGTPAADLSVDGLGQLTVLTPPHAAGTVVVTLVTPAGSSVAQGGPYPADTFTYSDAPAVTSVSPAAGRSTGGGTVVLTGSGFTAGATVSFGSSPVPADDVAADGTHLAVRVPPHAPGAVDLTVSTDTGTSGPVTYTYSDAPSVTVLNPAQGPAGTRTTVFGLGLTGATGVSFDGTAGTDVVVAADGRSVAVTAPAHAAGQVTVVVTTPAGSSETTGDAQLRPYFTYTA